MPRGRGARSGGRSRGENYEFQQRQSNYFSLQNFQFSGSFRVEFRKVENIKFSNFSLTVIRHIKISFLLRGGDGPG